VILDYWNYDELNIKDHDVGVRPSPLAKTPSISTDVHNLWSTEPKGKNICHQKIYQI
jgi:hypothetical protein